MGLDRQESATATLYRRLVASKLPELADRPAIRSGDDCLSYAALERAILAIRGRLVAHGVQVGDRVLLRLPNSPALIAATLAVGAQGAVAVPLELRASAARTSWVAELTAPALVLEGLGSPPVAGWPAVTLSLDHLTGAVSFSPDPGSAALEPAVTVGAADPALILLSSGSTGRPKGVVLTHLALGWSAHSLARLFDMNPEHCELIFASLAHSGAWQRAIATLAAGGQICLFAGPLSIAHLLAASERYSATGFYTPPHLVRYLLNARTSRVRTGLSSLRHLEVGSAELAAAEVAGLLDLLPTTDIYVHYGLTECSRATVLDARRAPEKLGSVGRPRPGVEIAIADPEGARVAPGQPGQILVRGPQMAHSYWRQPELTAGAWRGGWLATGDDGSVDADGFLTFRGRRDDLINCAGHTFFPREVEAELGELPGIREYLVVRARDPRGMAGDVAAAVVVPTTPESFDPASLLAAARAALPPHMVPQRVLAVPALPRTNSAKPDRRRAAELLAETPDSPDQPV